MLFGPVLITRLFFGCGCDDVVATETSTQHVRFALRSPETLIFSARAIRNLPLGPHSLRSDVCLGACWHST